MDTNWQTWEQPQSLVVAGEEKEPQLKLSLETRILGDVMVVHCHGRIVYRDEASALSRLVERVLRPACKLVLDLSGVSSMDSAGIGELVLLHGWALERNANLKCAGASPFVKNLLELTNLDSVIDLHPTLESAIAAFRSSQLCAV